MRVAILDDWHDTLRTLPCFSKLKPFDVIIFNDHVEDVDVLAERLAGMDAVVLIRERTHIRRALVDRLPHLRLISQRSVWPHIDVEACTEAGVMVCSNMHAGTPSYATAELTWGLLLSAARRIPQQMASLRAGSWQLAPGMTLRGRRLGVYGYGRIGKAVAGYAQAFGMRVWVWGGEGSRQRAAVDGIEVAGSRAAFFSESDHVTLHVRLLPATRGVITAEDLALMPPHSILVNTSRAGLVQEGALLAALRAGRPGMAAVDVLDKEPVGAGEDPLVDLPNVVCTPHIGYVTLEEWDLQFSDIFDQVVAYSQSQPINVINAAVFEHEKQAGMER